MPDKLLFLNGIHRAGYRILISTARLRFIRPAKTLILWGNKPLLEDQYHLYLSGFHGGISPVKSASRQEAPTRRAFIGTNLQALLPSAGAPNTSQPPGTLYTKIDGPNPEYKLIGVMYMARYGATEEELNARIPLSIAQWLVHLNMCVPQQPEQPNWLMMIQPSG